MKGEKEKGGQPGDNEAKRLHLRVAELERSAARQKRLERRLSRSRRFMDVVFDGISDAISIVSTANFRIIGANRAFLSLFKSEEKEVVGKYYYEVIRSRSTPCGSPDDTCPLMETVKTGEHSFAEQIHYDKEGREIYVEVSTFPLRNEKGEIHRVLHVARDITRRWQVEKELRLRFVRLAEMVSRTFSLRDPYAGIHERGAARFACLVGAKLGVEKEKLHELYIGGLLHDIGKVAIPEEILVKSGPLTPEEWMLIRTYPRRGYELLQGADLPCPVAEMALHHQERLDGSGYPDGLRDNKICREVRIIAACSVVSAMVNHRPYRPACSREEIIEEMAGGQGRKFDARVVKVLLKMITSGELEALNGQNL